MSSSTSSFKALAFPLVIAAVLFGSLRLLVAVYDRPNWASMGAQALDASTRIVAMGSSRIFFGLDPRQMPRATVNLSVNYLDGVSMRRLWRQYRDRVPNVDTVIAELCVVNLKFDTMRINPKGLRDLGVDIVPGPRDFLTHFEGAVRRLLLPVFTWRLTPEFYRMNAALDAPGREPMAAVPGFVPTTVRMAFPEDFGRRRVAYFQREMQAFRDDVVAANIDAYKAMIGELNAAGKRVVLIRFPIYQPVYHLYPTDWVAEIDRTLKALRADPTLKFEFWDEHAYQGVTPELFRDPEHLNAAGAGAFTRYVAARLGP
jgi:hypothetical protein